MDASNFSLNRGRKAKLLAVAVYTVSVMTASAGIYNAAELNSSGYYRDSMEDSYRYQMNSRCSYDISYLNDRFQALKEEGYFDESTPELLRSQMYEEFMADYQDTKTNFFFTIRDMNDTILLQSYEADYQCSKTEVYDNVHYEETNLILSEEEMQDFEFPENVTDSYVEEIPPLMDTDGTTYAPTVQNGDALQEAVDNGEIMVEYDAYGTPYVNLDEAYAYLEEAEGVSTEENVAEAAAEMEEVSQQFQVHYTVPVTDGGYYITGYVSSSLTANDRYRSMYQNVRKQYRMRYLYPIMGFVGSLLAFVSLLYLCITAGYRGTSSTPQNGLTEKIPFDLFTVIIPILMVVPIVCADEFSGYSSIGNSFMVAGAFSGIGLLLLWWTHSLIVRIRTKIIFRHNILYYIARGIFRMFRRMHRMTSRRVGRLPLIWKVLLKTALFCGANLAMIYIIAEWGRFFGVSALILFYTAVFIYFAVSAWNMQILEEGGQKLASGSLTEKIPEKFLIGHYRKHAQNLNSISDGMNKAVSDRLKSEMFRTELIANVSHDIRTPLTSIINYTDLLSKLDIEGSEAQEYLDVLEKQSARLRKLTEDVLEASKATAGTVKVKRERMDFQVLLEQIEGEFSERFAARNLKLVTDKPETPLYIYADGRQLWRVMDNLFNNVCKYAMEGTRVYLTAKELDEETVFTLRNISAVQLNISAEELMERFVRGDRSRNTEGSGLGLSIAQSLTALQGGLMELQIDGDLFKVILHLPKTDTELKPQETSANGVATRKPQ